MTHNTRAALAILAALGLSTGAGTAAATPSTAPPSATTERSTPAGSDVSTFVLLDAETGKVLSLVELPSGHAESPPETTIRPVPSGR